MRVEYTPPNAQDFTSSFDVQHFKAAEFIKEQYLNGATKITLQGRGRPYNRYARETPEEIRKRVREARASLEGTLQKWEGYVLEIHDSEIYVILCDLTNPDNPREQAIIDINKFPEEERPYIKEGAYFLWTISENEFKMEFYKDIWTQEMIDEAKKRGKELLNRLNII